MSTIHFDLDGNTLQAQPSQSILQAAAQAGVSIPHLCYHPSLRVDGNCRACMVEIEGERTLAASCHRKVQPGMKVKTQSERVRTSQRMVVELLSADIQENELAGPTELSRWKQHLGVDSARFGSAALPQADASHPAIAVNMDACIQCTRCLRACREEQANDVIGYALNGHHSKIIFDQDDPMGQSSCVGCGECVQVCPTGALMPQGVDFRQPEQRSVDSVCPYCGVGCQLRYHVQNDRITHVSGRDGPANHSRLCVKGRFGFDYIYHPQRLTQPLIRRKDAPKIADFAELPADPMEQFREASWDEALDYAAAGLLKIRNDHGPAALAGFGSAKGSNEEAYLFQKLIRTGFGTNNVDHCTRLCHASSVAALLEGIGSGAVSNQVADSSHADVIILIGTNTTVNHPVAATFIKNAARNGTRLIVIDPRRTEMARYAWRFLQFKPDSDIALLNAMLHTIIAEGLMDPCFLRERVEGFESVKASVAHCSPEKMAPVCGIEPERIREAARAYAQAKAAMIFWGMGISQHIHGTDNARCLIALSLITGHIGRPGTGLHPLRGQNNVQGASDAGLIPMVYPDYQPVSDEQVRQRFERAWQSSLDPQPGLTVVEIMQAAYDRKLLGMYIMGENTAMSDPDLRHTRTALSRLQHLVVQDLFLTETAYLADVVLPASAWPEKTGTVTNTDRRVQMGRAAVPTPAGVRNDLDLIVQIAQRMGLDWQYSGSDQVFEEMRQLMPSIQGISWDRLEREHSVTYPCANEQDSGASVVFIDRFPRAGGRAKVVGVQPSPANEIPDDAYPLVLTTGRLLEHWHTGAMTRRASHLQALEDTEIACMHEQDLQQLHLHAGDKIRLQTRRGSIEAYARADNGIQPGTVFMPFCYPQAAVNLLTNDALDPFGKIPEFKYCAVSVSKA